MEYNSIKKLFGSCTYYIQVGADDYRNMLIEDMANGFIEKEDLKRELIAAIQDPNFDWVTTAINERFIEPPRPTRSSITSKTDLASFVNRIVFNHPLLYTDEKLTIDQIDRLQNVFNVFLNEDLSNIDMVLKSKELDWVSFGVKHLILLVTQNEEYRKEDIVYYTKSIIWESFFPEIQDKPNLYDQFCEFAKTYTKNNGWISSDELFAELHKRDQNIDLYTISKLIGCEDIQYKIPIKNGYTLGFFRYQP